MHLIVVHLVLGLGSDDPSVTYCPNLIMDTLVNRAIAASKKHPRVLITIAGIPGSGKSTTAKAVAEQLRAKGVSAEVVGMDGYHYTRAELEKRIGTEKAVKFRGAPYTFDAPAVVELAHELANNTTSDIYFPTFDHAVKDPVENGGKVSKDTQVVLLEGNYLHLKDEEWRGVMDNATDTWFVDVPFDVARERLAKRHLQSGIVDTLEAGYERADSNDLVNGKYIVENSRPAAATFQT